MMWNYFYCILTRENYLIIYYKSLNINHRRDEKKIKTSTPTNIFFYLSKNHKKTSFFTKSNKPNK